MKITRKIAFGVLVALLLVCTALTLVACKTETTDGGHVHQLVKHEAVEATCTEDGSVEYWSCSDCNKKYSNAEATTEIESVAVPAAHKGGTEIRGAVEPTEYVDGYSGDTYCLGCGEVVEKGSVLPHTSTTPALIVSSAKVEGDTVTVVISLINDPGIAALRFSLLYDTALSISSVKFAEALGSLATSPEPYINPQTFNWVSVDGNAVNGEFVTVTFTVDTELTETLNAEFSIIILDEDDVFDFELNAVAITTVGATVTVNE